MGILRRTLDLLDDAGNEDGQPLAIRGLPHLAFLGGVGAASYFTFAPALVDPERRDLLLGLAGAVLAFAGLIVGFVANLMLFSGKLESAAMLTLEELRAYAERLRVLLFSQALTLVSASILAGLCVGAIVMQAAGEPAFTLRLTVATTSAYFAHAGVRSLLLPLQIFELHDAWLADIVEQKQRVVRQKYERDQGFHG